jgi:hypothetical protein
LSSGVVARGFPIVGRVKTAKGFVPLSRKRRPKIAGQSLLSHGRYTLPHPDRFREEMIRSVKAKEKPATVINFGGSHERIKA